MNLTVRQALVALRLLLVMTLITGVIYPFAIWTVGRIMPGRADGSLLIGANGKVVGSALIGQDFSGAKWFWPRPSAAGQGYDPLASGGSNLAADNPVLVKAIAQRKAAASAADGVTPSAVPPDAVTASGSGLDPAISVTYALEQVDRVAKARGLSSAAVQTLVDRHITGRILGFIGEPYVNVLELNLALENMH